jgi:MoxR-like ATPase
MAEGQVTIDGERRQLPQPFFVAATENPVEFEGTFPLPEAQKDRFLLTLSVGYPDDEAESAMLENQRCPVHPVEKVQPVTNAVEALRLQALVTTLFVDPTVKNYLLSLVHATRSDKRLRLGISPRGTLALYRGSQALAGIRGRDYVTPEDVKEMAFPVFRQRCLLSQDSSVRGVRIENVIDDIIDKTPIPEYRKRT